MTMTQQRERCVPCVSTEHGVKRKPKTSHESGLCPDCLELRREAIREQARAAAAVSAYPLSEEDRRR